MVSHVCVAMIAFIGAFWAIVTGEKSNTIIASNTDYIYCKDKFLTRQFKVSTICLHYNNAITCTMVSVQCQCSLRTI